MKTFGIVCLVILALTVLGIVGNGLQWFGGAQQVAHEEFGARAMLDKYTMFKDQSAALDAKLASIKVYEGRMKGMDETYKGTSRLKWPREDREQYNVWSSEVAGVKASYNTLASEYNANMAKFNWRFANKGMLPEGATTPLPREYKPYVEK